MHNIQLKDEELNNVLQALYLLQDQEWYKGNLKELIAKLDELISE